MDGERHRSGSGGERARSGRPGRVGVCLTSGFFGFFAHTGFVLALERLGIRPVAATGSSAGAIVAALWASGRDGPEIRDRLLPLRRAEFWDLASPLDWLRGPPGLLRGDAMQRLLEKHLACRTFEECRFPVAVNAFNVGARRATYFRSGPLAPAVRASASLPGLFQPARIAGGWYLDGGFVEKTPLAPLLERGDVDVVLVHHLRSTSAPALAGRPGVLDVLRSALETLRGRLDETLLAAAERSGKRLVVVEPDPPRVDPFHLERGAAALEAAREHALRALGAGATATAAPADAAGRSA
ncbi:MAG: patatin-like phospholipase family protein [Deltaproteobacteria bacterium]|nr:patatin-like phospholipase family protein [Deltaproteobacteria bacterium]